MRRTSAVLVSIQAVVPVSIASGAGGTRARGSVRGGWGRLAPRAPAAPSLGAEERASSLRGRESAQRSADGPAWFGKNDAFRALSLNPEP